jgi:hypothetical protein
MNLSKQERSPQPDSLRSETKRLEDICAALDATVLGQRVKWQRTVGKGVKGERREGKEEEGKSRLDSQQTPLSG